MILSDFHLTIYTFVGCLGALEWGSGQDHRWINEGHEEFVAGYGSNPQVNGNFLGEDLVDDQQ